MQLPHKEYKRKYTKYKLRPHHIKIYTRASAKHCAIELDLSEHHGTMQNFHSSKVSLYTEHVLGDSVYILYTHALKTSLEFTGGLLYRDNLRHQVKTASFHGNQTISTQPVDAKDLVEADSPPE